MESKRYSLIFIFFSYVLLFTCFSSLSSEDFFGGSKKNRELYRAMYREALKEDTKGLISGNLSFLGASNSLQWLGSFVLRPSITNALPTLGWFFTLNYLYGSKLMPPSVRHKKFSEGWVSYLFYRGALPILLGLMTPAQPMYLGYYHNAGIPIEGHLSSSKSGFKEGIGHAMERFARVKDTNDQFSNVDVKSAVEEIAREKGVNFLP